MDYKNIYGSNAAGSAPFKPTAVEEVYCVAIRQWGTNYIIPRIMAGKLRHLAGIGNYSDNHNSIIEYNQDNNF